VFKLLKLVASFTLDAIASLVIMLAAMIASTGAAFVGYLVWDSLANEPNIWKPIGVVCGTVGGLVGASALVTWAWARLNREGP
jgi:hypothetical protein